MPVPAVNAAEGPALSFWAVAPSTMCTAAIWACQVTRVEGNSYRAAFLLLAGRGADNSCALVHGVSLFAFRAQSCRKLIQIPGLLSHRLWNLVTPGILYEWRGDSNSQVSDCGICVLFRTPRVTLSRKVLFLLLLSSHQDKNHRV